MISVTNSENCFFVNFLAFDWSLRYSLHMLTMQFFSGIWELSSMDVVLDVCATKKPPSKRLHGRAVLRKVLNFIKSSLNSKFLAPPARPHWPWRPSGQLRCNFSCPALTWARPWQSWFNTLECKMRNSCNAPSRTLFQTTASLPVLLFNAHRTHNTAGQIKCSRSLFRASVT